jgi:hypothetical protein
VASWKSFTNTHMHNRKHTVTRIGGKKNDGGKGNSIHYLTGGASLTICSSNLYACSYHELAAITVTYNIGTWPDLEIVIRIL